MNRLRSTPSLRSTSVLALAALIGLGALGLSACSSAGGGNALSVNGTTLSNKDFQQQLQDISGDAAYMSAALKDENGKPLTQTTENNAYLTTFTTQVLNQQVTFALAAQEVANRGLTVSDDDRARAEQVLANDLGTQTTDPTTGQQVSDGSGQKVLDDLGSFKATLVAGVADILAIQDDLKTKLSTDEALKTAFDAGGDTYKNQACVQALLVIPGTGPTQDPTTGALTPPPASDYAAALPKAQGLTDQVRGGTDITTLAGSADNAKAGIQGTDLGCRPLGSYQSQAPQLEAAVASQPVGQVSDPVKTDYGYFVILVTARGDLTFEQAKPQLQAGVQAAVTAAFRDWVNKAGKDADVVVDPQWGSWDKDNGTIIAPGAATSTTTSPAASDSTTTSLSPEQLQQLLGSSGGGDSTTTAP